MIKDADVPLPLPFPPPLPERNSTIISQASSKKLSSLEQLRALDLFRCEDDEEDIKSDEDDYEDESSFVLEHEEHYVKHIEQQRGEVLTRIDSNAGDRLKRKVGYEIERRLVRAKTLRTMNPETKRKLKRRAATTATASMAEHYRYRRRRRRHRHRFCVKCVTSSFAALFGVLGRPLAILHHRRGGGSRAASQLSSDIGGDDRLPTPMPKMLLGPDGRLQWPVLQVGGGSNGMLISAEKGRFIERRKSNKYEGGKNDNIGRENFSLDAVEAFKAVSSGGDREEDTKRLLGWLQLRDPKNVQKKNFIPVLDPSAEGPFRKAPWHGNIHVLKF